MKLNFKFLRAHVFQNYNTSAQKNLMKKILYKIQSNTLEFRKIGIKTIMKKKGN